MYSKLLLSILSMEDRVRLYRIILTSITIKRQRTIGNETMIVEYRGRKLTLITMNECIIDDDYRAINPFAEDYITMLPIRRYIHCNTFIRIIEDVNTRVVIITSDHKRYTIVKKSDNHYTILIENCYNTENPIGYTIVNDSLTDILKIDDDIIMCHNSENDISVNDWRGCSIFNKISGEITHNAWDSYSGMNYSPRMKALEMKKIVDL